MSVDEKILPIFAIWHQHASAVISNDRGDNTNACFI